MSHLVRYLIILLSGMFLQGCLQEKQSERIKMDTASEVLLENDCRDMNEIGDIKSLLNEIHQKIDLVLKLSADADPRLHEKEIGLLGNQIHEYSLQLESLLKPEWTDSRWPYQAQWNIFDHDLSAIKGRKVFEFKSVKVQSVILKGIERPDLIKDVNIKFNSNSLEVRIKKTANSLEICQLQDTFAVILSVHYRVLFKDLTKYFKLSVRPKNE